MGYRKYYGEGLYQLIDTRSAVDNSAFNIRKWHCAVGDYSVAVNEHPGAYGQVFSHALDMHTEMLPPAPVSESSIRPRWWQLWKSPVTMFQCSRCYLTGTWDAVFFHNCVVRFD